MGHAVANDWVSRAAAERRRVAVPNRDDSAAGRGGRDGRRYQRRIVPGIQPPGAVRAAHDADELPARHAPRRLCAQKKRPRPSEIDRPDVRAKRAAFLTWVRHIDPKRLVFLDEAGANIAMGRSHAWVQRGTEYVEARPMNWGDNLTMVGAIRRDHWVTLSTKWRSMTKERFVEWVRRGLAPRLRRGDIILMDNLKAHLAPEVRVVIEQRGATLRYLPPYSHDFNPIEAAWGLVKQRIRQHAPRTAIALRRVARAARHVVRPHHCQQWFAHAGYVNSSTFRD